MKIEPTKDDELKDFLSGEKLYGDDFEIEEIKEWYDQEKKGCADLIRLRHNKDEYGYHFLNVYHGYRHLYWDRSLQGLALGGALGHEFLPVSDFFTHIVILDTPEVYRQRKNRREMKIEYREPTVSGKMLFPNDSFDLITCFGVLHHIPNVTFVVSECFRSLRPGGYMLLREPIVSMGDWRKPRVGLTKNERGIPLPILDGIVKNCGFEILQRTFFDFSVIPRIGSWFNFSVYNNKVTTMLDAFLSKIFSFNTTYHRTKVWKRFGPSSVFYVLRKNKIGK